MLLGRQLTLPDGAIAYGVGHLNNSDGLEGFRWLFVGFHPQTGSVVH